MAWILIAILAGLLVAGFATYFAVDAGDSPGEPAGTGQPTATTPAPTEPPTPTLPAPTEPPTATTAATTEPPPTPDTRVPIRDLPTADQIPLGPDGKYFIADRGDGCRWVEHSRDVSQDLGEQVVLVTDCPVDFGILFRPGTGEVFHLMP